MTYNNHRKMQKDIFLKPNLNHSIHKINPDLYLYFFTHYVLRRKNHLFCHMVLLDLENPDFRTKNLLEMLYGINGLLLF